MDDAPAVVAARGGRKGRLHGTVVTAMRDMIVTGELAAGQRIKEQALCERLGVSRTPLREALKTLASEGLIRLLPNRSAEVVPLTLDEVESLFQVIGALESLAGELACAAITDEQIAEIGALHYRMVLHHIRGELAEYFELNQAIHRKLVEAAGNPVLMWLWDMLAPRMKRARFFSNTLPDRWPAAVKEHEEIFAALSARDSARLAALMRPHFTNGLNAVKGILAAASPPSAAAVMPAVTEPEHGPEP